MTTPPNRRRAAARSPLRFFQRAEVSPDGRRLHEIEPASWDRFYRDRWAHDKVVRSTHGVNCTGSCAWQVFVKDGLITWEHQATDYPSVGPDSPEYEPRGCPRGASFSWYTYSPSRVRYPYVRGVLLQMWRDALAVTGDPVEAWADIVENPLKARAYKLARGKGGFLRSNWDEVAAIVAAAHVHTIKTYGPDRVVGFSPIPAMSMASFAAGARFLSLIGGTLLSFYDWYADLPIASPQVWGDQTDVPESADWWNSTYLIMWGSNIPVTRTPDAHFMTEARYKGMKVVAVSPDYADNVRFADDWLAPHPGTDGALAMAMGHVILSEFFRDRQTPYFTDYVRSYTDLPFLVTVEPHDYGWRAGRFLTAADLGETSENAEFKTVLLDDATGEPAVPNGSVGFRWGETGEGRWNLELGDVTPRLSVHGSPAAVSVALPRFDIGETEGGYFMKRGVPVVTVAGKTVTTVYDLLLAQYGVRRDGLPGEWPADYGDPSRPYTPEWGSRITGVPAAQITTIAREFARNAERSHGRSMIAMGAGTNHWFHSDTIYRAFLALVTLTGCQGRNGGGWAHYVGQEKVRPVTGLQHLAFAYDWQRPTRHMAGTAFWYLHSDQWRYETVSAEELASPLGKGLFAGRSFADCVALSARLGWMPSHPTFDRNPLDLADDAAAAGTSVGEHVVGELKAGRLRFAAEDPDAEANRPRVLTVWRANLLGSSAKGNEFFLRHLLGADDSVRTLQSPPEQRPEELTWREPWPSGKLDLLTAIDFRMTSTGLFADVVLPAATWYEKHDLSSTDMHPFVHAFNPAIAPPWQTRSDYDTFLTIADTFSELAETHLGTRTDVVAAPLQHDTPDELAQPGGRVRDWKAGECEPIPGRTMPKLVTIERDYPATAQKLRAIGPLFAKQGLLTKGVQFPADVVAEQIELLRRANGEVRGGVADGQPSLASAEQMCEAILTLSGATNGHLSVAGFHELERRTGVPLADLASEREGERITFEDTKRRTVPVLTSPEWSGSETGGRRYSAFVINTERRKPWHTLTGRQHFFLDHDWIAELGEQLPAYRPPLALRGEAGERADGEGAEVTVRYLTPHSKWSIHSTYQDNAHMLALSRGGPAIWMSTQDAAKLGVADNEWVEAYNRNGVVTARAVVTHRMPEGTVYMYHAKDRTVDVPKSTVSGRRGGIHNSLTRLLIKPSHLIGGYAQFTYAFNYYGPTGNQRDELTVIRRRSQHVGY